ncbi:MAG: DUF2007 domain-containing protein [Pirellulales bacterium]
MSRHFDSRLVCVFVAENPAEAHLVRNRLADYGIDAVVQNDQLHAGHDAGSDWAVAPRVMVPLDDSEFAREVAEDFEQRRLTRIAQGGGQDWPEEALEWEEWPRCPRCKRRRLTRCPGCLSSGTRFPLAEFVGPESPDAPIRVVADDRDDPADEVLVVCATCDEAFHPDFYRRCEACGYEFARGIDPESRSSLDEAARRGLAFILSSALLLGGIWVAWKLLR